MAMKRRIIAVVLSVLVITVCVLFAIPPYTPEIENENSVSELRKIEIDGIEEYILVRGEDKNNPAILFVHGGPGQAEIGYITEAQKELEQDFVVVRWDQRGAGLSASGVDFDKGPMLDSFVDDADIVTDFILETYGKDRIYLAGHSWGTIVGIKAAANHPERNV